MNAVLAAPATNAVPDLDVAIDRACARIAPNWPLDQLIAVNPLWGWVDQPFDATVAALQALAGSRLLMPRAWYREQYAAGRLRRAHLAEAIARAGAALQVEEVIAALDAEPAPCRPRALVTDCADALRDTAQAARWSDFVTHAISQFCAAYFDEGQSDIRLDRGAGLYGSWRAHAAHDAAPRLLMGLKGVRRRVRDLPLQPRETIRHALAALAVPAPQVQNYLTALLLSINGWAAWCAYQTWQAQLQGGDGEHVVELLAIRLAWEWLLLDLDAPSLPAAWREAVARWPRCDADAHAAHTIDRLLQHATEIAYQHDLGAQLGVRTERVPRAAPDVQAVFCIDVRSEVFRRALEGASAHVDTLGCAGFFGLPADYRPLAAASSRPQLPGLFAPRLRIADTGADDDLAARRTQRLQRTEVWRRVRAVPPSAFAFVEAGGLAYAGKLLADTFGWSATPRAEEAALDARERQRLKPRLVAHVDGREVALAERVEIAAGVLAAMNLTRDFARLVLLLGHGAATSNNPHAAALDCGACGGQSGEANARAVASLLNDAAVRDGLAQRGIHVPADTHVIAGLHNTTTDAVRLFDLDEVPATHRDDLARLTQSLREAERRSRAERAPKLGLSHTNDDALRAALVQRARDGSQVRAEWGLADCAAFVVAPRARTQHLNLAGRVFLHEYRWHGDAAANVLATILTGPMVVAHWINLQYYASTVDNRRFGSGNKVLHNVVGGRIGVFEGNGGDLRIGLPLQSLHDGVRWRHEPLRLSVFVEAPAAAIDAVLQRHPDVARLVDHGWLHLFRLDGEQDGVWRRVAAGVWLPDAAHAA